MIAALESTAGALAVKAATRSIPIVFRAAGDPVSSGLVSSLNHPDANITGITTLGDELEAKRLELLRELLPPNAAVAVLVNPTNANVTATVNDLQGAAVFSAYACLPYAPAPRPRLKPLLPASSKTSVGLW